VNRKCTALAEQICYFFTDLRKTGEMNAMRRREVIGFAAAGLAALLPRTAISEVASQLPLVVWFSGATKTSSMGFAEVFLQGMRELGYVEGRNFDMIYRFSEGFQDRLPTLAEEIVGLKPDVIVATAVVNAVVARKATSTIPIVCPALADAVHLGLIAKEGRPSGNVTGIEPYVAGLPAKQMEIARKIVPNANRIGLLTDLKDPKAPPQLEEQAAAGRAIGVTVLEVGASGPGELDDAMRSLAKQQADVVIVLQSSMLIRLASVAKLRNRLWRNIYRLSTGIENTWSPAG
jgi:putative tryptophan/tyrosine transport system substrate-binding protein